MASRKEISEQFSINEEDYNLFEKKIDETHYWERIRFRVFRSLLEKKSVEDEAHPGIEGSYFEVVKNFLAGSLRKSPLLGGKTDVMFVGHPRRKKMDDGLWWDIYCDSIIEETDIQYTYIESRHDGEHKKPAKTEGIKYFDLFDYLPRILNKIIPYNFSEEERKELDRVQNIIQEEFDVTLNIHQMVKRKLGIRRFRKPLIKTLLSRRDPGALVIVVGYRKEDMIEAAKELEIPVIELQHGVINKHHKGYHYPGDRKKETFPDYLLTFGEYWSDTEYPIPDEKVIATGYPYFDMMKKKFEDVEKKDQILFISQGTIGEKLSKFAVELSKQIQDYEIVYKLHPGEFSKWQERYQWLEESEIEVLTNEKQLYQLFAESKIQVGVYSTAIYEGLGFNLKTFLVDLPGIETMERLLEKKYCRKINSAEDLMENREDEGDPEVDIEEFFKPNAKENIIEQLNRIKANQ